MSRTPRAARLALVLACGLFAQLVLLQVAHVPAERPLVGDEPNYHAEGLKLAAGGSLTPHFIFPPLQFHLIGAVYRVFGPHRIALELVQSALLLGAGVVFRSLLAKAGLQPVACDAALALFLLDPQIAAFAQYLWPEVLHLFLSLLCVRLVMEATVAGALGAGIAGGLAMLAKSLLGPFVPALLGAVALQTPGPDVPRRALRAGAFAAGLFVILVPVVVSNGVRHGYWGIANSGPFNVWVGLNDPASRTDFDSVVLSEGRAFMASAPNQAERNRLLWPQIREKVARAGFVPTLAAQVGKQYGRLFDRESFLTDQLPGGRWYPGQTPQGRERWLRTWAYAAYAIVLALAGLGLAFADWKGGLRRLALPGLFLAYNLGLFLILHVKTRYRVAFMPSLLFFAAIAVEKVLRVREGRTSVGAGRAVAGLVIAGAMLALAFGRALPPP